MSPDSKAKRLVIVADEVDGARRIVDAYTVCPGVSGPLAGLLLAIGAKLRDRAAKTREASHERG